MKILIIQTSFIGDVVLITPVIEKLHKYFPDAQIDVLIRKGNEALLTDHPKISSILLWDKHVNKIGNLIRLITRIRSLKYDIVINAHRYFSSGIITVMSGAVQRIGFKSNPLSVLYSQAFKHQFKKGIHEVDRNLSLIQDLTDQSYFGPRLYYEAFDQQIDHLKGQPYLTISPSSIWETKQLPVSTWIAFLKKIDFKGNVYLLGSSQDHSFCEHIAGLADVRTINLAGQLHMLESVALMKGAVMNYTLDSAPLHFASAVNAPVTAVFCSTTPDFGFGPKSERSHVVENDLNLACRPCGFRGKEKCPEGHFHCGRKINPDKLVEALESQ